MIRAALFGRFESRGDADFADRIPSAIRKQFGRHDEKRKGVC
jgi:6-phosphogluconate dehydrogenase